MDNPQELKKAILATLAEKGDYKTLLEHIDDEPNLKKEVLGVLAEQGDYSSILKALNNEQKKSQTEEAFSKIAPLFQFSEMITKDAKGSFMQDLQSELDEKTTVGLQKLSEEIEDLKEDLREITATLLDTTKSELVAEHLGRYSEAEKTLGDKMLALTVQIAAEKAEEMFGNLAQEAKLTEDEIEDIIEMSALSVESQIAGIIGEYISETKITPDQIVGFAEAVKKLLPTERQISWGDIVNKPDISQGGTSAILVKQMIDAALAEFTGGGVPVGGTTGQVLTKLSDTDGDADWQDPAGVGGAVDSVNGQTGVVVLDAVDVGAYTTVEVDTLLLSKQDEAVVVSSNQTATNDSYYVNVASATYTDPSPVEGKGFIVFVRNGTATVGGTGYGTAGTVIHRIFHSGAWANYVYQVSSTFALASHTHTASEVTDFSTASDARIAAAAGVSIASLSGGKVPTSQLPALALTDVFTVASQVAQLALTAEEGDVAIRTDQNKSYIHNGGVSGTMTDWSELLTPTDAVFSVNGEVGAVTLTTDDISDTGQTNKWTTAAEKTKLGHITVTQAVSL